MGPVDCSARRLGGTRSEVVDGVEVPPGVGPCILLLTAPMQAAVGSKVLTAGGGSISDAVEDRYTDGGVVCDAVICIVYSGMVVAIVPRCCVVAFGGVV